MYGRMCIDYSDGLTTVESDILYIKSSIANSWFFN